MVETKNGLKMLGNRHKQTQEERLKVIIEEFIDFDFESLLTVRKENGENIFVYQLDIFNLMETINVAGNL